MGHKQSLVYVLQPWSFLHFLRLAELDVVAFGPRALSHFEYRLISLTLDQRVGRLHFKVDLVPHGRALGRSISQLGNHSTLGPERQFFLV